MSLGFFLHCSLKLAKMPEFLHFFPNAGQLTFPEINARLFAMAPLPTRLASVLGRDIFMDIVDMATGQSTTYNLPEGLL